MDPRPLTITLLLALVFRPILSAAPSPSASPFLPHSLPPAPDSFPSPPAPSTLSPPSPSPSPATLPPFHAPLSMPPNRMAPDRSAVRPPLPWNTSPTHPGYSSSCPSGRRDCHQPRQSVNRESSTRPGLNFGQKLGLFFIGVFVALQVVFGTFLVYIKRS